MSAVAGVDLVAVVLGVLLVAGAAAFALLPLVRRAPAELIAAPSDAARERFALYRQVVELEFDQQTGKLSAEDYRILSGELLARAAGLLRDARGGDSQLDQEIEREIAAARRALSAAPAVEAEEVA